MGWSLSSKRGRSERHYPSVPAPRDAGRRAVIPVKSSASDRARRSPVHPLDRRDVSIGISTRQDDGARSN